MLDGVVAGGWEFVIAAYGVTVAGWLVYAWWLSRRQRAAEVGDDR